MNAWAFKGVNSHLWKFNLLAPIYNKAGETVAWSVTRMAMSQYLVHTSEPQLTKTSIGTVDVGRTRQSLLEYGTKNDFNGTVVSQIDHLKDYQMVTKWGLQPAREPLKVRIHWWARLNQSKKTLKTLKSKTYGIQIKHTHYLVHYALAENHGFRQGFLSESDYELRYCY